MRVFVIKSIENGHCNAYGEGEYLGSKIPDSPQFKENGIKNPCIKLDSGKYIWGFQCYWGSLESYNTSEFKKKLKSVTIVDFTSDEILPVD